MLRRLLTDQGERSTYDAVSQCSRCGYCEQVCPTYVATGEEGLSPRGRNQALRLLLEGKLEDRAGAERFFATCLLCGACQTACYTHVRVPDLVLEGRRLLRAGRAPRLARLLGWLLLAHRRWIEAALTLAYLAKRLGLSGLASRLGFWRLAGYPGLGAADLHVREAPHRLLAEELRRRSELRRTKDARFLYFAACGPNYVLPRVGRATVQVLSSGGKTAFLDNGCCGLLPYNYGNVATARELARNAIRRVEDALEGAAPDAAVVADCSSCAAHLKAYPQLFVGEPQWRSRAEAFVARVKDVIELLPGLVSRDSRPLEPGTVVYHDSCRARNGQGVAREPREALERLCGSGCAELPDAEVCCGGAGAFSFLQPELSDAVLRRKVAAIAGVQAKVVGVSSTSCWLQLADGLRRYYPECRVAHLSELAAERL
ncbi:MAG: (Fe-S)-binding protein [Elusimicrobia bacterium]|nr:(Fe-S)-binding protein [Elusimicrobiota bacterium]